MKFLKINFKVLLILCLFSGILFLSTGCDNNETPDDAETENVDKNTNKKDSDKTSDSSTASETNTSSNVSLNNEVDYSVWVANTTINTDKSQRSYKVIWGDTLWLISTAWDVSYQEIARFNHIPNPDLIYVDQIIYNPLYK